MTPRPIGLLWRPRYARMPVVPSNSSSSTYSGFALRAIGFDDDFIYQQIPLAPEKRSIAMQALLRDEAQKAFGEWRVKPDKIAY